MDALLHWDFSPGQALADQVRRRFGSSVHFSPRSSAKEFFQVVSFSSASFGLTEKSVGLALQCCLGGDRLCFRVFRLSDRRFRFSVASNKVGHFIYGLKDRVWPDFICHFTLFRGAHPSVTGFFNARDPAWHSSEEIVEVSQRSPTRFNPDLGFLEDSSARYSSPLSSAVLSKFGFLQSVTSSKGLSVQFGTCSPVKLTEASASAVGF